jgi:hypothetical protein
MVVYGGVWWCIPLLIVAQNVLSFRSLTCLQVVHVPLQLHVSYTDT